MDEIGLSQNADSLSNRDRALIDDTLHFVAERSWQVTGEQFFHDLVLHLGKTLEVGFATCGVISPEAPDYVNSVALYSHGEVLPNVRYSVKGAPCEHVIGQKFCSHKKNVAALFPEDLFLAKFDVTSYAGIPLWSSDRMPLGIINIMDEKELEKPDLARTILQIVAVRAGAELERYQVLAKLREGERRFADFASVSSDWFWETDENLRFSYFSHAFEDVTGRSPEELMGKTRAEIGAPGATPLEFQTLLDDMDARKPFRDFQHYRIKPTGEIVDVAISGLPSYNDQGKFIGYRGSGRDISQQKRTERQLIESRDAAFRASKAKSDFLAKMSHEFRTPLNAILGMSEIIYEKIFGPVGNDRYSEYALDIHRSGKHMLSLINDVLDIAAIEAGKREIEKQELDLADVLSQTVRNLTASARKAEIELVTDLQEGLPPLIADERSITQIVLNLLSNALKFTAKQGKVTVGAQQIGDDIQIQVIDTGIGITKEALPHVMEPFSQAQTDPHLMREGTGLGLSIVQALVDEHQGTVSIDSAPGKGTTVTILLPLTMPSKA